jgi:hypothetical protein
MNKRFTFGEIIDGLVINNKPVTIPVINEREARATAGIMLVFASFALLQSYVYRDFTLLSITTVLFSIEFIVKVLFGTRIAPFSIVSRFIVRNQEPEWVGAAQKRFAWSIGIVMAISMVIITVVLEIRGAIPFTMCSLCILFMWMEASFSFCVGCKIYWGLVKIGVLKTPTENPLCAGNSCAS